MRILATVALATVLGVGGAYVLKGKPSPEPRTPSIYRIAEIPKADSARIAALSAQSVETTRPPPPVAPKRVAAATPQSPAGAPSIPGAAKARLKPKAVAAKQAKSAPQKAKPKTVASR